MMFDQKAMDDERAAILKTIAQALEHEGARDISTICNVIREMKVARDDARALLPLALASGYDKAIEDAALFALSKTRWPGSPLALLAACLRAGECPTEGSP